MSSSIRSCARLTASASWGAKVLGHNKAPDRQLIDLQPSDSGTTDRDSSDGKSTDGHCTDCKCTQREAARCQCASRHRTKGSWGRVHRFRLLQCAVRTTNFEHRAPLAICHSLSAWPEGRRGRQERRRKGREAGPLRRPLDRGLRPQARNTRMPRSRTKRCSAATVPSRLRPGHAVLLHSGSS